MKIRQTWTHSSPSEVLPEALPEVLPEALPEVLPFPCCSLLLACCSLLVAYLATLIYNTELVFAESNCSL